MMGDVRMEWLCGHNQGNLDNADAEIISMTTYSSSPSQTILPWKGKKLQLHIQG